MAKVSYEPEVGEPHPLNYGMILILLLPLIFQHYLRPIVTRDEFRLLLGLLKRELEIIGAFPFRILFAFGVIKFLWVWSDPPPYWLLAYLKYYTIWKYHGMIQLQKNREEYGERYGLVCQMAILGYLLVALSYICLLSALHGLIWFDLTYDPEEPTPVPPEVHGFPLTYYKLNGEGEIDRLITNLAPGFSSRYLHSSLVPDWLIFFLDWSTWQHQLMAAFRWSSYLWFWVFEQIDKLVGNRAIRE